MAHHVQFHYRTLEDLQADQARLGLAEPAFDTDVSILAEPVKLGRHTAPNAFVAQPMEGCDSLPDGSPGPLTTRRYQRFAAGGAGTIWVEACAVAPEARGGPRQLWLHEDNRAEFAVLLKAMLDVARDRHGERHRPLVVLQLTHSGRYSRPTALIAQHNPELDPPRRVDPDQPVLTDDYLDRLPEAFVTAARLAAEVGFDAVDVKCCHGYLFAELLGCHTRPGRYGGAFENRARLFLDTVEQVRAAVPEMLLASRLGVYDAVGYPYAFGVSPEDATVPDLAEPKRLVGMLAQRGVGLLDLTIGNPYYNPHYGRPYDRPAPGGYEEPEHPLEGMARIVGVTREIAQASPAPVVAFGYSWLRQFAGYAAAATIRRGWARMIGLGRMSFAHPGYPNELLATGKVDARRVCRACSKCTQIMRAGGEVGCPVFDAEVYLPILKRG